MFEAPHTVARRRLGGILIGGSGVLAALALGTKSFSQTLAEASPHPDFTLAVWSLAACSALVGCVLFAHTLRGPRTRLPLAGCVVLAVGILLFFGVYVVPQSMAERIYAASQAISTVQGSAPAAVAPSGPFMFAVLLVLLVGGTLLGYGLDGLGVSHASAGALWAASLVGFSVMQGVLWAETLAAAGLALALLVMGADIARFHALRLSVDVGATPTPANP